MRLFASALLAVFAVTAYAHGQTLPKPDLKAIHNGPVGTPIREMQLYVGPAVDTGKVQVVTPGHELAILESSGGGWLRVFANTDLEQNPDEIEIFGIDARATPVSGWVLDKGVIRKGDPGGDRILFGAAVSAEDSAADPHAPKRAAEDARLLYKRTAEYFPDSPLAPEAAWRSADIRWQLEAADSRSHPSAHEKEYYLREQMNEEEMKKIEKKYPGSKWAGLAAWDLIQNKICGDWQGSTKCPLKEAEMYEKYVSEHGDSPRAPQALYAAAWRMACAGDMFDGDDEKKKAAEARDKAQTLAKEVEDKYPQSDYSDRAANLVYRLQKSIPVYGNDRD